MKKTQKKQSISKNQQPKAFTALFEHSLDAVCILDNGLCVTEANTATAKLLQREPEKLEGIPFEGFIDSDQRESAMAALRGLPGGAVQEGELSLQLGSDDTIEVTYRFVSGFDDETNLLILHPHTESFRDNEALRESELDLDALMNVASNAIGILDSQYRIVASNEATARRFGFQRLDDFIGKTLKDVLTSRTLRTRMRWLDQIFCTGKPRYYDTIFRNANLRVNAYPILGADNRVSSVMIFAHDITEQMHAERKLRESEQRYRILVENLEEGINIGDMDENIIFVNEKAAEIFGLPRDELMGRNLSEFVDEETLPLVKKHTQKRARGESSSYHVPIRRADGKIRMLYVNAAPFYSEETSQDLVLAAFHDVTEQTNIERELEESRRKYELLVENLDEGIGIVDPEETFVFVNDKAASIFGVGREELIGVSLDEFLDTENVDVVHKETQKRFQGVSSRYEHVITRPDGQRRVIAIVATPFNDEKTGKLFVLGAFQDITESKRIEARLRESEERLRSTLSSMHDLIFVINLEGVFTEFYQPTARSELLVSPEEFVGRPYQQVLPNDVVKKLDDAIASLHQGKMIAVFDYSLEIGMRETWHSANVSLRRDADGQPAGYTIVARDISGRKVAEEALMDSERRLRTTLDTMLEGCVIISEDWRYLYVNEVAAAQFGSTTLDLLGRDVREVLHDIEENPLYKISRITMEGRIPQVREMRYAFPDGSEVYLDLKIQPVPEGLFILSLDITERKKAETELASYQQHLERIVKERTTTLRLINEQLESEIDERLLTEKNLRESEAKFRSLVENAHDGILILQEERIVYVNQRYAEILGYTKKDVIYQELTKVLFEEDAPFLREVYFAQITAGKPILMLETRFKNVDGDSVPVELSCGRISYRGEPAIFAFVRDVTQRRKAENKLEKHRKRLQNLAAELTLAEGRERRRIAVDLHDHIGQNLVFSRNSLETASEMLTDELLQTELRKVSEMLNQTIDDTRTLMFEISPPILYDLGIEAALEWLLERFEDRHGLQFVFQSDGKPKELDTDTSIMMFQASRESLVNVVKHAEAESVVMRSTLRDGYVRIEIEDDGKGFDVSTLGGEWRSPGSGFGLFSVRERIISLGGSYKIDSKPGEGTRVTISLPTIGADALIENEAV